MDDLISRQAAIEALTKDKKALEHIINGMSGYEKEFDRFVGQRNQVDYDIDVIKQLPPAQPEQLSTNLAEVGKDLISRQEAIETFKDCAVNGVGIDGIVDALKQLPPIQPEPKRGKWIYQNGMIKCDQCLRAIRRIDHDGLLNFCPNCGADMREATI